MALLRFAVKANQAQLLPALLLFTYIKRFTNDDNIEVDFCDAEYLIIPESILEFETSKKQIIKNSDVIPHLLNAFGLADPEEEGLLSEWIYRSASGGKADLTISDFKTLGHAMQELDSHLTLRSFVVGYSLTPTDIAVWGTIKGNKIAYSTIKRTKNNISRWFDFVESANPWMTAAVNEMNAMAQQKRATASAEGGSYDIGLTKTEGGVVTRFPPEPSGYLHIGHAKAALLNDYFAHERSNGILICRFDDTNPSKESQAFQDSILADLALMKVFPDRISHSSDFFPQMYEYCFKILRDGNAYADNTDRTTMQNERKKGIKSQCRDATVSDNLRRFEEMKSGTDDGIKWCIRAKISVDDVNKALRDPVIYRCNRQAHHRTGTKWKIYPTYDFCAPILDSIEGVTNALRTNEYRDRNPQYAWIQRALGLRQVEIFDFARMNFIRTCLSKRKLTQIVDKGVVQGWDDPRMPTVRGIQRRGMTMDTLREFMIKQGPSQNIINQDWTQIWAINRKNIDAVAPRYTAVIKKGMVEATIKGAREASYIEEKPKHNKNPDLGLIKVTYSKKILIDQDDAQTFDEDEEITLMNWGNAIVRKKHSSLDPLNNDITSLDLELHLEGDFKKTKKKITWLSQAQDLVPVELVAFDYLITKDKMEKDDNIEDILTAQTEFRTEAVADCNVAGLAQGDIIQFERKGYFRVDRPYLHSKPAVLFEIPTGKTK